MHNATRLQESGVEFKCAVVNDDFGVMFKGVSYNCYKIGGLEYEGVRFEKGVLKLLTIDVEYEIEIHFRNLMAFK
ncbi:hypothetical protein SCA6_015382 [Theobroma cacao]